MITLLLRRFMRVLLAAFVFCVVAISTVMSASEANAAVAADVPAAPINVSANTLLNGTVQINWTPAPQKPSITVVGFDVYRGSVKLIRITIAGTKNPNTYTDQNPPQIGLGLLGWTVDAVDSSGRVSAQSASATPSLSLPLLPQANATPSASAHAAVSTDLIQPDFRHQNAKTAFEEYGGSPSGVINNTYGALDPVDHFNGLQMSGVVLGWAVLVFVSFVAMTLLAWSVTPKLYQGFVAAATAIVQAVFALGLYKHLVYLAIGVGALIVVLYFFSGTISAAKKGASMIVWGLLIGAVYTVFAPTIVGTVMTKPTVIGQAILGQIGTLSDSLTGQTGAAANRFNISVNPTYNGDSYEQGVRRFEEREYLNTIYASTCKLNFGDLDWATKTYVADRVAKPANGFHHLTACEYFVRAKKLGDDTESSYLQDQVQAHAPPDVWEMFQGKNASAHWMYMAIIAPVVVFRTILLFLTAYTFAVSIIMLGFFMVKATLALVEIYIPPLQAHAHNMMKRMAINFGIPLYMAIALLIGILFSTASFNTMALMGWVPMMVFQVITAVGTTVAGLHFRKRARARDKEIKSESRKMITDPIDGFVARRRDRSGPDYAGPGPGSPRAIEASPPKVRPRPGSIGAPSPETPEASKAPSRRPSAGQVAGAAASVGMAAYTGGASEAVKFAALKVGSAVVKKGGERIANRQAGRTDSGANRRNLMNKPPE